jgi:hypothetical protein
VLDLPIGVSGRSYRRLALGSDAAVTSNGSVAFRARLLRHCSAERNRSSVARQITRLALRLSPLLLLLLVLGAACRATEGTDERTKIEVGFEPSPPRVGKTVLTLTLTDETGSISGATLTAEGNMNHAGMRPTFAELQDLGSGRYRGELDFTMGGDWFILVTGVTRNGQKIFRKVDVKGVHAQ